MRDVWVGYIIGATVLVFIMVGGIFIGHSVHESKAQGSKIQIECIEAGGRPTYELQYSSVICMRD